MTKPIQVPRQGVTFTAEETEGIIQRLGEVPSKFVHDVLQAFLGKRNAAEMQLAQKLSAEAAFAEDAERKAANDETPPTRGKGGKGGNGKAAN